MIFRWQDWNKNVVYRQGSYIDINKTCWMETRGCQVKSISGCVCRVVPCTYLVEVLYRGLSNHILLPGDCVAWTFRQSAWHLQINLMLLFLRMLHYAVEAIFSITDKSDIYVRPRVIVWAFYKWTGIATMLQCIDGFAKIIVNSSTTRSVGMYISILLE